MKLSIITINLNNASGLLKTIESIVQQTTQEFEHIIIDGGSTDGSVDIIKRYTNIPSGAYRQDCKDSDNTLNVPLNSQISYWVTESDKNIYHAMNKGILASKGEYCQFLNSGDTLANSKVIEDVLPYLTDKGVYLGYLVKEKNNGKIYVDKGYLGALTFLNIYSGGLNHSSAFIRRQLFDEYGFYDENYTIVSDWKWFIKAIVLNNVSIYNLNFTISKFDMNGISNTNILLLQEERRKVLNEIIPPRILADYDSYWGMIHQANRINQYRITRCLFWLFDRILFKYEKFLNNY
jgi:glycosyltransferase involved in cell wall biosynthesis